MDTIRGHIKRIPELLAPKIDGIKTNFDEWKTPWTEERASYLDEPVSSRARREDIEAVLTVLGSSSSRDSTSVMGLLGSLVGYGEVGIFEEPGSYTWVVPPGVRSVTFTLLGGGGGGGGGAPGLGNQSFYVREDRGSTSLRDEYRKYYSYSGAGGGSGAKVSHNIKVTPGESMEIVVGGGGKGGAVGLSGSSGGTSSFGDYYAGGGGGGRGGGIYLEHKVSGSTSASGQGRGTTFPKAPGGGIYPRADDSFIANFPGVDGSIEGAYSMFFRAPVEFSSGRLDFIEPLTYVPVIKAGTATSVYRANQSSTRFGHITDWVLSNEIFNFVPLSPSRAAPAFGFPGKAYGGAGGKMGSIGPVSSTAPVYEIIQKGGTWHSDISIGAPSNDGEPGESGGDGVVILEY